MVVAEEGRYCFFHKVCTCREHSKEQSSHPAYGKLFVNIFHVHGKILEG